jgi:hypothetical protein
MSRKVSLNHGWFVVSDDPEHVIGMVLNVVTNNRNRPQIAERLAPNGNGFHLETFGAVTRIEGRDELPEPRDQDATLDPDTQELWVLYREPDDKVRYLSTYVLTGDELRSLVTQAEALLDARGRRRDGGSSRAQRTTRHRCSASPPATMFPG